MILTGPLCSHFPYHCPQPVQLLAWPFRWQRPADRHGGHLVRTTLLLPWHLSQDIWTFRHISSIFTCFTFLAVHQFMSFLQARVPKVAALSVVWIANGEIWWTSSLAACCGILQQPISLVFPGHWTNSSLAQDRSMHISCSRSSLGGSQECITILQVSQPKPFPNVCRQTFQVTATLEQVEQSCTVRMLIMHNNAVFVRFWELDRSEHSDAQWWTVSHWTKWTVPTRLSREGRRRTPHQLLPRQLSNRPMCFKVVVVSNALASLGFTWLHLAWLEASEASRSSRV